MTELPISGFMRNCYKETGSVFPDSQKATIIWNSDLPRSEIFAALREIAENTADAEQMREQRAGQGFPNDMLDEADGIND